MKKVEFSAVVENQVEVTVNGDKYGVIKFDAEQNVWVLWPEAIDDAVTYTDDLTETKEDITDEIQSYNED